MKRALLFVCLFAFGSLHFAQEYNASDESQNSLLWEISREDIPAKSYLFGTNHIISSSFIDTSVIISECIKKSSVVITELEKEDLDTALLLQQMKMNDKDYYSFSDSDDEKFLQEFFRNNSLLKPFAEIYFILKPMAYWLFYFYGQYIKHESPGTTGFTSLDDYFVNEARNQNKELKGLETVTEQMSIFMDSIPIKTQLQILMETIRTSPEKLALGTTSLNICYLRQDVSCMSSIMIFGHNFPEENRLFLERRNLKWMKKLPSAINYKSTMIAVGAGHLPGTYGLINLLRIQGYEVKPIKF
ncbi:MAG TPA: TraB/GumN family protein [Ignavibacteria bacterium]|nr:hypothetical protein [Bacteroidota bacterium]HRE12187.1 TraB/GumN family protein [Ignavibacteria bacterium]HRF65270.1 TraB/GumN family protein [Ignavibacteria bacterium]HRJ05794.1 TraB/GumN family protein [Ignavibacteria bacterium]